MKKDKEPIFIDLIFFSIYMSKISEENNKG